MAWHSLGWTPVAFSEIEPFPSAVLAHHYPNVPNWGDMTKFKEWPDADVDVLVGGTPCQSFSVAGLRKGMADPRGNLALTFLAIADRYRPEWLVWENVPGVLSSNGGRDFGSILGGMVELGYGVCYRVLDAQYFGVAQRRRRVFVVGCLGDWRRAAAVLLEPESLRGDSAPRREAGERPAPSIAARTRGGGGPGTDTELDGGLIPQTVGALTDGAHNGGGSTARTPTPAASSLLPEVAWCLQERDAKGADSDTKPGHLIPVIGGGFDVAHSLRADGFDASEDGTGRGTPLVPVAFAQNQRDEVRAVAGALAAEPGMKQQTYIAIQNATRCKDQNGLGVSAPGEPMYTLDGASQHAIAFSAKEHGADAGEIAPTLRSMNHAGSHANGGGQVAIAIQGAATRENPASGPGGVGVRADDTAYTIEARSEVQAVAFESRFVRNGRGAGAGPSGEVVQTLKADHGRGSIDQQPHVLTAMQVRRLTPRECERLQGFPDDYTLIPHRGKPAADGPRYKALGNSMAVPVMRWIGERIDEAVATAGASCTPR